MIIADDESLVRVSLSSMIKDMEASWHIVDEATNGEELLQSVEKHKPDIAIVDIRMPKLSGMEAIRLGKSISPLTRWVILSGFSDFGCAQQALKLGVSEYLLKPVDPAELEKTLLHIYKDNKDYIALLNQQFENNLFALCNGLTSLKYEDRGGLLYQGRFAGRAFLFDTAQPVSWLTDVQRECYEAFRRSMEKHLAYGMNLALLALPSGELAAVGAWNFDVGQDGKRRVHDFFEEIEAHVRPYNTAQSAVTVLHTGECSGFEELNARLQQLQQLSELRSVYGVGRALDYAGLAKEAEQPDKLEAARLLCAIGHHFQDRTYLNYSNAVNEWDMFLQRSAAFLAEKTKEAIRTYVQAALGLELSVPASAQQMVRELRQYGESVLLGMSAKEPNVCDLVRQVTQYVEKHYMDDIGIGQIAGQLNVSANYLSALFHKKTGVMFVKYLTRIRMQKALELLMNTNLQVRQVAEQVGYYSARHFTKLFTQTFGSYPSDYRKNQIPSNM